MESTKLGLMLEYQKTYEGNTLDLKGWFGEERKTLPIELEIGSGAGIFLKKQALKVPLVNYVGLEWSVKYWNYAVEKIEDSGINNVRLVRADANIFIRHYTEDEIFRQIHIYFPDPWPKRKHNKRRIIQEPFLRELYRVLEPGGLIRTVTDHPDYFKWIEKHADKVKDIFSPMSFIPVESAEEGELVGTKYEQKFRRKGLEFYGMMLKKI